MLSFETAQATQPYRQRCEDYVAAFYSDARVVIVAADGAGGIGGGDRAAQTVIREVGTHFAQTHSANEWVAVLKQMDCRVVGGESTVVVVDLRPYGIAGASVGDSHAVIVQDGAMEELTAHQNRKPLLGSGMADPVGFTHAPLQGGLLVVGTDGLFDYAKTSTILAVTAKADFLSLPRRLIEMVKLPSGEYWDDIGIVAARCRPRQSTRRKYEISS